MITQAIIILISVAFGYLLRDLEVKKIRKQVQKARVEIRKKTKPKRGVMMEWTRPEAPEKEAEEEARKGL